MKKLREFVSYKDIQNHYKKLAIKRYIEDNPSIKEEEIKEEEKAKILEEYLKIRPRIEKIYIEKIEKRKLIVKNLAVGSLIAITAVAGIIYHRVDKSKTPQIAIEQGTGSVDKLNIEERMQKAEKTKKIKRELVVDKISKEEIKPSIELNNEEREKQILKEIKQMTTDKEITEYRKIAIVEAYNKTYPNAQITKNELEIYKYTPSYLVVTEDKFGNIIKREMCGQVVEGKKVVNEIGLQVYEYRINGKTVAIYDDKGNQICLGNFEKQDIFFEKTVPMVEKSERLKDAFNYVNSKTDIQKAQEQYAREVIILEKNMKTELKQDKSIQR